MSVMPTLTHSHSYAVRSRSTAPRASKATPESSPEMGVLPARKLMRPGLSHSATYSGRGIGSGDGRPDIFEMLPATTYQPPSPRGRLVAPSPYVRPSLRLDPHMMPSADEIIAATQATTRGRRSGSASSTSSCETVSSTRSEKRQGRLFMPTSGGILDLLTENREMEE